MDEGALDLAVVDGGVDGVADVQFYVGTEDGVGACEEVEFDFAACYAL